MTGGEGRGQRAGMDQAIIDRIAFFSCLLGLTVGTWLFRWSRRQLAAMDGEQHRLLKRRLGLWGRRAHARALLVGAIVLLYLSLAALVRLLLH